MADVPVSDNQEQRKNILEEKSKEDLIKLVKKYLHLLQKSKNKTDELNKKCAVLEQERDESIQLLQSTEIELKAKKEQLQHFTSELEVEKKCFSDNDPEIEELKQKLEEASAERNRHIPILHENEEQIQCLKLQLKTLKDSCQCLQEENKKLQKSNKEKLEELSCLSNLHESLSSDLNKNLKDYDLLLNVKEDIERKYEKSVEKIHSLQTETDRLLNENKELQENIEESYNKLSHLEKCEKETENDDLSIFFEDMLNLKKENEQYKKQIESLSKNSNQVSHTVIKNETDNSDQNKRATEMGHEILELQNSVVTLEEEKGFLETKNRSLQLELDKCYTQIHKLEDEIKTFVSSSELNDYKMGIELALLQGAKTEGLIHPVEQHIPRNESPQTKLVDSFMKSSEIFKNENIFPFEGTSGFEFALLQGGDASNLAIASDESGNTYSAHDPCKEFNSASNNNSIIALQNSLEEQKAEIISLKKKLKEYSSLCSDTIEENNILNEEIEILKADKNKTFIHQNTNTDFLSLPEGAGEFQLDVTEKTVTEAVNVLQEDHVKLQGNYENICNKMINFCHKIQSEHSSSKYCISDDNPLDMFTNIETVFNEMVSRLRKKEKELNNFNLQLELLIIGVKQGVRQKTPVTSYQTENSFEENMNMLKSLLDELATRSSSFDSKKCVQMHPESEICVIEDELNQLKELNQFLEVENRELNSEIEKLKSNLGFVEGDNGTQYFEEVHQQKAELYSIDESNEFDYKSEDNLTSNSDKESLKSLRNISIQALPAVTDSSIQVESDLWSENKMIENTSSHTDSSDDKSQQTIKHLTDENNSLQNIITEKSNLVENIHCQLDHALSKVEELIVELQNKDKDLKHAQCLNADLRKILTDAQNIKNKQLNALEIAHDRILDFRKKNIALSEEVKSLSATYNELIANVNIDILKNVQQNYEHFIHFRERYVKEETLNVIKEWVKEFAKEFEDWNIFMDQITPESQDFDMSKLERTIPDSYDETSCLFKKSCNKDICCYVSEIINNLVSYKVKLFSFFYNHLNSNYRSLINDLHNCKANIIPSMEKNIVELEKKIAEYSVDSSKEVHVIADNVQEDATHEESLKRSLADTEVKMNKFKQIALKLKKDLNQTKEQYNDAILEKEKLMKLNSKLTDELNKISEDQCKYVQNFQSLQKEFDNIQDENEAQKHNMKKLEEDFATKLVELTSSKEQILELENQLKSSRQLFDSNVTIKKELDNKCADLESKIIILESKITLKEQKIASLETDVAKHLKEFTAVLEDNKNLKYQLELAQKEGNKKSLLDLEMADYEKSITELNNKIKKKDDEIEELQNEVHSMKERNNCLQDELKSTEMLKETEAKRAETLKGLLEKTKSELSEIKEHESELLSKVASLEVQLETMIQQEEDFKLQLSETSAQIRHLQDIIKTSSENHQRVVKSFEQKVSNQKQEIQIAHKEVESLKQEFENYKIRVHSVLKQQKSVTPSFAAVDSDLTEKLETINEKLKIQVKDLSEKIIAMSQEYDVLQDEHDSLLQRYNKVIDDKEQKDKEWHQRLELINAEKNKLRTAQEELSSQHLLQNEMLVATYKKQIKIMSDEHKRIVNDLQKQLDAADVEIARLQRDQQKLQGLPVTPSSQDSSTLFDLFSQERQEGEGSENTDEASTPIRNLSLATIPTSGFLPFEKLLQSPVEPGTPASYVSNLDSEKLAADLHTANKTIDHLSELLNDSESTNLRLSEQVRVLKEELRRLEYNKEREQHAENLEYLKNVFIKFATLQPGSEKAMLIPVLTTMLKLSPNEQQQLKSVAGDMQPGDNMNSSWGGYLHRWSGLS